MWVLAEEDAAYRHWLASDEPAPSGGHKHYLVDDGALVFTRELKVGDHDIMSVFKEILIFD